MSLVEATAELFSRKLDTVEGKEKMAEFGGSFIRDKLREVAYCRHIIPPEPVTRNDCQRSTNHDTLVKIVDVEPKSKAMALTFRDEPTAVLIRAPKAEIPFFSISSQRFEKPEQELMAYEAPITKIIEDNSVKDIQEIEDRQFTLYIESAVQAMQSTVNTTTGTAYNATNIRAKAASTTSVSVVKGQLALAEDGTDFDVHPLQRPDCVSLFKLLDTNRLRAECVLLTEPDYDDILSWTVEDNGDKIQSETVVEGYRYNKLLGKKLVRTIKTDILRPGVLYVFAAPQFFGKFYMLNKLKFYIDKIANVITWQCWEDIGIGIVNIAAVRKLELFRGSVRPTATDTGFAARLPSSEEDLGAENNKVDSGLHFPDVAQY